MCRKMIFLPEVSILHDTQLSAKFNSNFSEKIKFLLQ